jgi:hypothetical protein
MPLYIKIPSLSVDLLRIFPHLTKKVMLQLKRNLIV